MEQSTSGHSQTPLNDRIDNAARANGPRVEEKPGFQALGRDGDIEIRRYQPMLLAEVVIAGDRDSAVGQGFDRLSKYISGENVTRVKIARTSPVLQEPDAAETGSATEPNPRESLPPLYQERDETGAWRIGFLMPSLYSLATAPQPLDPGIQLLEVPASTVAVMGYAGPNTEQDMEDAALKLQVWLATTGRIALSPLRWAQYAAPLRAPFLKRNEVLVDIQDVRLSHMMRGSSDQGANGRS